MYASRKIKLPFTSFNLVASIIFKVMLDELGLEIAREAMIKFWATFQNWLCKCLSSLEIPEGLDLISKADKVQLNSFWRVIITMDTLKKILWRHDKWGWFYVQLVIILKCLWTLSRVSLVLNLAFDKLENDNFVKLIVLQIFHFCDFQVYLI